nr:L-type lectin-domain containing receptor kinase IX.1-like [Tanacetum cinerariifolium]
MAIFTYFLLFLIPYAASISFNFSNFNPSNSADIIASGGGAYISDDGIQLTPEKDRLDPSKLHGRATYVRQLHLWDSTSKELASFSTRFSFVIDSYKNYSYADGLTFFLAENNSAIYGGGAMGLPYNVETSTSTNPFVAVEFDTFCNFWDPEGSDPDTCIGDHVGMDINNITSVKSKEWFSNITYGRECEASIKYDSTSKKFSVSFTGFQNDLPDGEDGLDYTIDLRDELPEWVIFGFSAATGKLFEKNNVKSWSFNSTTLKVDEDNLLAPTISPKNIDQNIGLPPTTSLNAVKGKNKMGHLVGLLVGVIGVVTFFAVLAIFLWRKKKSDGNSLEEHAFAVEMDNEFEMGTTVPRRFSYLELAQSTSGFSKTVKLGEGGFGEVYKGFLKDSRTYVAVKRVSKSSDQGVKEYASEVMIISRLRHRNLVQLVGWCHEKGELLLVYEFMENGSLDLHLFKGRSLLTWSTRCKIAHGLASAISYLHEEWEQCVLHRDVKSSNVMLDSNFNVKLGDFGLAKLVDHEKDSQTTIVAGTLGYMAPEYVMTGKASKESDVFSFGVVALEIACGRKAILSDAQEQKKKLVEWVWDLYGSGTLLEAVDPFIGTDFSEEEVERLMIVGLWCAHPDSNVRPSIKQAIQVLNFEATLPLLPSKMPLLNFNSTPTSSVYSGFSGSSSSKISSKLATYSTSSSASGL